MFANQHLDLREKIFRKKDGDQMDKIDTTMWNVQFARLKEQQAIRR